MKIVNNKRGVVEFLLDIWAYILFAVAIAVFLIIFKLMSTVSIENKLISLAEFPTSSSTLLGYLRTPVSVDSKMINMAEFLRLWYFDDRHKDLLEKTTIDLLNTLEYEYTNAQTKNTVTRGFQISVNTKKKDENTIDPIIDFKSKSFDSIRCISNQYGCVNLGEQFIPISETATLYIVLRESQKTK